MESEDPFGQSPKPTGTLRSPPRGAEEPAPPMEHEAPAETQSVSGDAAFSEEGAEGEGAEEGAPVTAKELVQMIAESGNTIPPSDVNEFAGYVAELTGQKIPATLKQRRTVIANWYAEQAPPIAAHTPPDSSRQNAPHAQTPDAAFERPPIPPDRETVLRDIAQHGAQVHRLAATLPWPAPKLPAKRVHMPPSSAARLHTLHTLHACADTVGGARVVRARH